MIHFFHMIAVTVSLLGAREIYAEAPLFEKPPHWVGQDSIETETTNQALEPTMKKVPASELPTLTPDGDLNLLRQALELEIATCRRKKESATWHFGERVVTRRQWCIETAQAFLALAEGQTEFSKFWEDAKGKFEWYRSVGRDNVGTVHFTGYYQATMRGKRTRDAVYHYPLYRKPDDLAQVSIDGSLRWRRVNADGSYSRYDDRKAIDWDGTLKEKGYEIVYTDDPVEAFFLHIQGSGTVYLQDEVDAVSGKPRRIQINYAAQNGHDYYPIGRKLKEEGVGSEYLTLQGMRKYFTERPTEMERIFPMNPSYIFFNEARNGPYGSSGTILTPGHSIATDYRLFPMGALALIRTKKAVVIDGAVTQWDDFARLMVNQDTGGAIRGPGRVDIFWGDGEYAELAAGAQDHLGDLYFAVVPKTIQGN